MTTVRSPSEVKLENLEATIRASGGSSNALEYAPALLTKVRCLQQQHQFAALIQQLLSSREQGDLRGRVLEVNFADCFVRANQLIGYGHKQGMTGDIDFSWKLDKSLVCIEMKLLREDQSTRESFRSQIAEYGVAKIEISDDTRDVFRLQADIIQKATTRKFNPKLDPFVVNLVAVDVSELTGGAIDLGDCLLAACGNSNVREHFDEHYCREAVVGVFENIDPAHMTDLQRDWVSKAQAIPSGAPHPREYLHGAIFLFRNPSDTAALCYELSARIMWNEALVNRDVASLIATELMKIIPLAK
jgi:hypothetical protein